MIHKKHIILLGFNCYAALVQELTKDEEASMQKLVNLALEKRPDPYEDIINDPAPVLLKPSRAERAASAPNRFDIAHERRRHYKNTARFQAFQNRRKQS